MTRRGISLVVAGGLLAPLLLTAQGIKLLQAERLSDDVSITVTQTSQAGIIVDVMGYEPLKGMPSGPVKLKPLSELQTEAWVLRRDGTALLKKAIPKTPDGQVCMAMGCTAHRLYDFESVAIEQIVGVVVAVDGKLYVREIATKPK